MGSSCSCAKLDDTGAGWIGTDRLCPIHGTNPPLPPLTEHDRRMAAAALQHLVQAGEALNATGCRPLEGTAFEAVERAIEEVLDAVGLGGFQPLLLIGGDVLLDSLRDPGHGGLRSGTWPFE
jgi:hypothetical protein